MIVPPVYGKLDQGLIFSGCTAEDYPDCEVHGIVITARCDLAHGKARVINYLPIVHFNDWLQHDYFLLLGEEMTNDIQAKIKDHVASCGMSTAILEMEQPRRVLEKLFPESEAEQNGKFRDRRNKMEQYVTNLENYTSFIRTNNLIGLYNANIKMSQKIIKSCIKQSLNGYYFLPRIDPSGLDLGYVVFLREVKSVPSKLAKHIVQGIDRSTYSQLHEQDARLSGLLAFKSDLVGPVGRLEAPHIEHLMQSFSSLFARIGLKDIDDNYVTNLFTRQPCSKLTEALCPATPKREANAND